MRVVREYSYQEQIDELSKSTGLSKQIVKRFLQQQRQLAQDKLRLGFSYNIKGVVKIEPKYKGEEIVLTGVVAQSVIRPVAIRYISSESPLEEIERNTIEDEELE